jgi:hypothetical protein
MLIENKSSYYPETYTRKLELCASYNQLATIKKKPIEKYRKLFELKKRQIMEERKQTLEIREEIINTALKGLKGFTYPVAKEILETAIKALAGKSIVH